MLRKNFQKGKNKMDSLNLYSLECPTPYRNEEEVGHNIVR